MSGFISMVIISHNCHGNSFDSCDSPGNFLPGNVHSGVSILDSIPIKFQ